MKDYYYLLGVSKETTIEDIKSAYRKLSLKFHPDKNVGDKYFEERFKEINEAYEYILNEKIISCPLCEGTGLNPGLSDELRLDDGCLCRGAGKIDREFVEKVLFKGDVDYGF